MVTLKLVPGETGIEGTTVTVPNLYWFRHALGLYLIESVYYPIEWQESVEPFLTQYCEQTESKLEKLSFSENCLSFSVVYEK